MTKVPPRWFGWIVASVAGLSCVSEGPAAEPAQVVLLEEDFGGYRSGVWLGVVDAHAEYQYLPETAAHGPWSVSTFRSDPYSQRAWRIQGAVDGGGKLLAQTFENRKERHWHPLVTAGDPLWGDYTLDVQFTPLAATGRSGVAVRMRHDRCYYFVGCEGNQAVILRVDHETAYRVPQEKRLAESPLETAGTTTARQLTVRVLGNRIQATFADGPTLEAQDNTFSAGKIGLMADVPTHYHRIRVTTSPNEGQAIAARIAQRERTSEQLMAANPRPVVWKQLRTQPYGCGRNVRFGDLDGDGDLDLLFGQIEHHGPKDRNSELSCLTAVTLEGKVLWQLGEPDPWKFHLTNDVAFQINDLDGDGAGEVIYAMHQELVVADGATGRTLRKVPTPAVPDDAEPVYKKFPRVLGDALLCCDLHGTGRATDLLLKDRYWHYWAFDRQLQPLWQGKANTGHYPHAADIDGDGRDEIAIGYSLLDDDGRRLWTLENELKDHADGVAMVRMSADPQAPPWIFCCASDEGAYFADLQGTIVRRHRVGHAQNPTVANLRDDLPGLEALSMCFWGNQGIVCLYDSRGECYHEFEPCQHGSPCAPTNWTGRSEEFFLLTAHPTDGGLFDGQGRRVVRFPDDGHPDMCTCVLDLTGDCRDEIVVWDPYEMWIYTQSDSPRTGRLYRPQRNPLYNASNYQAHISLPGWSE